MSNRPQRYVRLCDLRHRDRGLDARRLTERLERVLQRERVDDRGEHPHVVGAGAIHASRRAGEPTEDVAAADDDRDLDTQIGARLRDFLSDPLDDRGVDSEPDGLVGEGLTRELQHDPVVSAPGHRQLLSCGIRRIYGLRPSRSGYSSPIFTRANPRTCASGPSDLTTDSIVCLLSFTNDCSTSTTDL